MFTNVIVKTPGKSLIDGITGNANFGIPVFEKAIEQHNQYIEVKLLQLSLF
jgi:dimethylargininase